jgi:hypothetical protein
MEREEALE